MRLEYIGMVDMEWYAYDGSVYQDTQKGVKLND